MKCVSPFNSTLINLFLCYCVVLLPEEAFLLLIEWHFELDKFQVPVVVEHINPYPEMKLVTMRITKELYISKCRVS